MQHFLSVSTDKEKYNPGDEISLSFPSPENARAIVTLENSTGVLDEIRVNTEKGNTVVKFRAKPEMAPNVYAYVTVIQPHAQTINDMPVRLYGIVPVMVEDPATRLAPVIDMPDEIRSQKPFIIKVSESEQKPMTYTLQLWMKACLILQDSKLLIHGIIFMPGKHSVLRHGIFMILFLEHSEEHLKGFLQ